MTGVPSAELQAAIDQITAADAVVASAPVYKAGISGLFKSFVDVLDNDLLIARPVVLAATAGSSRYALVVDEQMRSLFAYMRALMLPTSVRRPGGLGCHRTRRACPSLRHRAGRRAPGPDREGNRRSRLVPLPARVRGQRDPRRQTAADTDFDSPLMRLAAGGRAD